MVRPERNINASHMKLQSSSGTTFRLPVSRADWSSAARCSLSSEGMRKVKNTPVDIPAKSMKRQKSSVLLFIRDERLIVRFMWYLRVVWCLAVEKGLPQ